MGGRGRAAEMTKFALDPSWNGPSREFVRTPHENSRVANFRGQVGVSEFDELSQKSG